jgi:hypothetical protein
MLPSALRNGQHLWGLLVRGLTVETGPLTGTALGITGRMRKTNYTQLDQQGKVWATKAQQDWPVNVAITRWLLDMQGIRVWRAKDTSTSSWSLAFIILAILIKLGIMFAPINYNMYKQEKC